MEALAGLAAFAVACNVMQTIHFGLEACAACKSVWAGKSPAPELESHTTSLQKAAEDLQKSLPLPHQNPGCSELQKVADNIIKVADKLQEELNSCKTSGSDSYKKAVKSLKYVVKSSKINKLSDSLRRWQSLMELRVLVDLREKLQHHQVSVDEGLRNIDQKTRAFIQQLRAGNLELASLIDRASGQIQPIIEQQAHESRAQASANTLAIQNVVIGESKATRDHVKSGFDDHRSLNVQADQVNRLLISLSYPEMNARKNASAITNNHENTYQWIFGDDDENTPDRDWSDFRVWLQSNESVYWISGKAGSGKSSLMRQLIDDDRTQTFLQKWRTGAQIYSTFIWNAGSDLQRSQVGLFATLLHQMLDDNEQAAMRLLQTDKVRSKKYSLSDWSRAELIKALKQVLDSTSIGACFFIDGLDEIDATQQDGAFSLLNLLEDLCSLPSLKMCLGSREEPIFLDRLGKYPRLRLQDLTRHDIKIYIEHSLKASCTGLSFEPITPAQLSRLTTMIVDRADGVFLWVHLVIKSIRQGLLHYDSWDSLIQRISTLPRDLSKLYQEMFRRLNGDDQQVNRADLALYFNTVLEPDAIPSVFVVLLLSKPSILRSFLSGGDGARMTADHVRQQCKAVHRQVLANCAGLLEVDGDKVDADSRLIPSARFGFIHRSARDFLTDTSDGQRILSHDIRHPSERACATMLSVMLFLLCDFGPKVRWDHRMEDSLLHGLIKLDTRGPSILGSSLELPFLDSLSSSLQRRFTRTEVDVAMLAFAAMAGSILFLRRFLESLPAYPAATMQTWKNRLLNHVCRRYSRRNEVPYSNIRLRRAALTSWLLREGADPTFRPSEITFSPTFSFQYQTSFIALLPHLNIALEYERRFPGIDQVMFQPALLGLVCEFLEHGADASARIVQSMDHFSIGCFGSPWRPSSSQGIGYRALIEMNVQHMFLHQKAALLEHIQSSGHSEDRKHRLRLLLDDRNSKAPKIILVERLSRDSEKGNRRFLSMNSEISADMEYRSDFENKVKERLHLDGVHFPLDEKGAVEYLVNQGYLPQEAATAENPAEILGFARDNQDLVIGDRLEILDSSTMDWSYKPEYDNFLAELKRLVSSQEDVGSTLQA